MNRKMISREMGTLPENPDERLDPGRGVRQQVVNAADDLSTAALHAVAQESERLAHMQIIYHFVPPIKVALPQ